MARWIDASPSQRFWQYTYPAARRLIENGEWDACLATCDAIIAEMEAHLAAAEPGSLEHRRWTRRLGSERSQRAGIVRSRDGDLAIIAEAERRKAARTARRADA